MLNKRTNMKDNLIRINEYEYVTTVDRGNVTIKYLTKHHKQPQSINDQYVEKIYSKVTKKNTHNAFKRAPGRP
jgi:hypothetical protein